MIILSAKAQLFVQAALKATETASLVAEAASLGPDPWSHPLTAQARKIAIEALKEMVNEYPGSAGEP